MISNYVGNSMILKLYEYKMLMMIELHGLIQSMFVSNVACCYYQ